MTQHLRHWRFHYRLRSLLIFVFLANLGMSWIAVKMYKANRQRKAVQAVRTLNGVVYYTDAFDEPGVVRFRPHPPVPRFVQHLMGDDYFADVLWIDFTEREITDSDLECLREFPNLEQLFLAKTAITDAGLEHVRTLCRLKVLDLERTRVTGRGFDALENLTCLETFNLMGTELDDAGLARLQHQQLPRLGCLLINGTKVTDTGLQYLTKMIALEHLGVGGETTDAGLVYLKGIPRLKHLFLWGIEISDDGLEKLKTLTKLNRLVLGIMMISTEQTQELRNALPNCDTDDNPAIW